MTLERLDKNAIHRVGGPAWDSLRESFLTLSETLLSVGEDVAGVLTTIYVKYQINGHANAPVFAVVWIKNSKQLILGLALPETHSSSELGPPPAGTKYKGLTKYLVVRPGDALPSQLRDWAIEAFDSVHN